MDSYALKSVSDLPAPFRSTFTFRYFNSLQSECFPVCFLSDTNMVISAPTGSGKTVLFELCILRLLSRFLSKDGKFNHFKGTLKTIYIAPSKALVQEKLRDWNQKLGSWGINCLELTGDSEVYNTKNIQEADIILTTPEKFDAVTRYRIRDGGLSFFSDIALLLIDEVHLLNDPRGASLEAIMSRIKMLAQNPEMKSSSLAHVRLVAVSATIPNIDDLGEWLMVPSQGIKRFGEEMRPVKLTTRVFDILMQHSRGKSALVFCSTRKGAQEAALRLSQTAITFGHSNPFIKSREQQERLKDASLSCTDKQMQSCILFGVGYHNGGLCLKDRNLMEGLFLRGDLQVLCTTNTLAHGINLPAHTVIIKSTQNFNKEKSMYVEYDRSMILQMCGRAGRPPFDDTGTVIIMTRKETVHLYENILSGCEMVESQLLSCVTEHLAAEIVQLTVSDISRAIEWMKCSYLYVRMKKNPEYYGIKRKIPGEFLEKHMQEPGKLMTKYYLKFNTMKHIIQTSESCSLEDLLNIICRSEEISWIQLRRNEKKLLNDINTDKEGRLRFHILSENRKRKKRIQTREEKIFVLANDCLTGDPLCHDLSFNQDMSSICSNGSRIAKCMKEYFVYKKSYKGVSSSTLLAKCLDQRLWDDSPYLLKQLTGIGVVTAKALNSAGINSFETLAEADPRRIEIVTGRKYPFGNHIKESLSSLPPKIKMEVEESEFNRKGKSKLVVTLTRLSQPVSLTKRHGAAMVVGSEEDNQILFYEKIRVNEFSSPYSVTILVPIPQQGKLTVRADLIFEEYIGLDLHEKLSTRKGFGSNIIHRPGDRRSTTTIDFPKEIYVVEDGDENNVQDPVDVHASNTRVEEISSMPSFELLDEEDMDEVPAIAAEEKGPGLTEQTIFDHIRRKAKDFPVFATSEAMNCSTSDTLILRKRQFDNEMEIQSGNQRETLIVSDSESGEAEKHGYMTDEDAILTEHIISGDFDNFNLDCLKEDVPVHEAEENKFKTATEETIFDHTRKKAKTFAEFPATLESDPMRTTGKHNQDQDKFHDSFEENDENSIHPRDAMTFSCAEPMGIEEHTFSMNTDSKARHHHMFCSDSSDEYEKSRLPWKVSTTNSDLIKKKIPLPSSNVWVKERVQQFHRERAALPLTNGGFSYKNKIDSSESHMRLCSLDAMKEKSEVPCFLGFKSVFSFL